MYLEGKDRFLKDLDWVSIVKSIRELKALMRVLLNDHQRQMLVFEKGSMLPTNKLLELKYHETFEYRVPFESESKVDEDAYIQDVNKFVSEYSANKTNNIDVTKILTELKLPEEDSKMNEISINDREFYKDV